MIKPVLIALFVWTVFIFTTAAEQINDCRQKARNEKKPVPATCVTMAKESAQSGHEIVTYQHLRYAVEAGFANVKMLREDSAFAAFRDNAEFQSLVQQAQKNLTPCAFAQEFRTFDFWIGEWTVTQNDQLAGESSIQLILDQCVIFENWTGRGGYNGKSFNMYNPADKKWHQLWVDNAAGILQLEGEVKDGGIDYRGETIQADGSKVLERITFRPLEGGRINQIWQQSNDGGKTWNQVFNGIYTRKPSAK